MMESWEIYISDLYISDLEKADWIMSEKKVWKLNSNKICV